MTKIFRFLFVFLLCTILACGSNDQSPNNESSNSKTSVAVQDPTGNWDVDFAVLVDACGLLPEDTATFSDFHTVSNENGMFYLLSDVISPAPYTGAMRGPDSLVTEALLEGDIFGDGTFCSLQESMVYNEITESSARALFSLRILCDDGSCETVLRGNASRALEIAETEIE